MGGASEVVGAGLVAAEAVGVAGAVDDDGSVQQPVQKCCIDKCCRPGPGPTQSPGRVVVMMIDDFKYF